jgi:predicted ester cyclase
MLRVACIAALLVLGLVATRSGDVVPLATAQEATPETACPATTTQDNAAVARRWFEEVLNEADLTVFDEMLSPQLAYHSGTRPAMSAGDVAEKVLSPILAGFPDVEYTVREVFSSDDSVTLIWSAQGTHTGPFQGYAPTGKQATWTGINVFRFECGRVVEVWAEADGLGRLRQMGLVGTPTP